MADREEFQKKLAELLAKAAAQGNRMTQEELANKMHVSKSAIAKWETDGGVPDRDNLYRLAEIIGASVDAMHHIMAGNASFEEKEIAPPNITQDVIQLLEAYGYEVIRPEEKRNIVVKIKEEER